MDSTTINVKYVEELWSGRRHHTYKCDVLKLTVEEVFNALKKNGFRHLREEWLDSKNGKYTAGCILGQAALNLQIVPAADWIEIDDSDQQFSDDLSTKLYAYTLEGQLDRWAYTNKKWRVPNNDESTRQGLATTIIHWNDYEAYDPKAMASVYVLKTYADVVNMAYDVLKPHFAKTILVMPHEFALKAS